jgi:hypothetical protein
MPNVLGGWTVVTRSEGVQRIPETVYIVKELAEDAAPGLRLAKLVVGDEVGAMAERSL